MAAEITNTLADFSNLDPMIGAALRELDRAGVAERPAVALADAGYWNEQHMDEVIAHQHIQVLIPPELSRQGGAAAGLDRRALLVDANRPGQPRQAGLPKTDTDDRARVRSHQTQPHDHPVSPKRQHRRAHRMAVTDGDAQPDQAAPPSNRRSPGLNSPHDD